MIREVQEVKIFEVHVVIEVHQDLIVAGNQNLVLVVEIGAVPEEVRGRLKGLDQDNFFSSYFFYLIKEYVLTNW